MNKSFAVFVSRMRMVLLIASISLLQVCYVNADTRGWYLGDATAMTTHIELEFWYDEDQNNPEELASQVFDAFRDVDIRMSRYRKDSELSRINAGAGKGAMNVSKELFDVIQRSIDISTMSGGAFDISFGSVGYLYDYRKNISPSPENLKTLVDSVDYRKIRLNSAAKTIELQGEQMVLDLGGIAKGYAVDLGINILEGAGVKHARLSAGGDMRLLGDKRGKPWIVGIQDPRIKAAKAVVLPLSNVAVSTSGDYERFFIDEHGERIHHILSPTTGKPAQGVQSVTVIGNDAIETDALSTAVFVLGVEDGLELINRLTGIDAIVLDARRNLHYSDGLIPPEHMSR